MYFSMKKSFRLLHSMTTYTIIPAHSGTSAPEIAKAKRLYRAGVKRGKIMASDDVVIKFSDVNYCITAEFMCKDTYTNLGNAVIYQG